MFDFINNIYNLKITAKVNMSIVGHTVAILLLHRTEIFPSEHHLSHTLESCTVAASTSEITRIMCGEHSAQCAAHSARKCHRVLLIIT